MTRNIASTNFVLILCFLPTIFASILGYGDARTSIGFIDPPLIFSILKHAIYLSIFMFLLFPLRIRLRFDSLSIFLLCVLCLAILFVESAFAEGLQFLTIRTLMYNFALVGLLLFVKSGRKYSLYNIWFLLCLFFAGFLLQKIAATYFGLLPSHTFILASGEYGFRYNGVTNDSLSTAILLPTFIPLIMSSRYRFLLLLALLVCGVATGSSFGALIVVITLFAYLLYTAQYKLALYMVIVGLIATPFAIDYVMLSWQHKLASGIVHLKFFFNLIGVDVGQSVGGDCSQNFCESFIESLLSISWLVLLGFYTLLIGSMFYLNKQVKKNPDNKFDISALCLGFSVLVASLVHPVSIIPFAMTGFIFSVFMVNWRSFH